MENYLCGCIGGILGTLASYPVDTLRVRVQSKVNTQKSLYSGVITPMLGIGLEKAVVFGIYNQTKKYTDSDLLCGLNAGLFASLVVTPVEKYKILKQNNPTLTYKKISQDIIKQGGIKPLYNGLSACFFREIPGYGIYFTSYNYLNKITNNNNNNIKTFLNGGLSGSIAWLCIYPMDTIKTNMQQDNTKFIPTTKKIIKEGRLYSGLYWSLLRAFTLHSCVFLGYELSKNFYKTIN